jgi:group I intron endonuclease
MHVYLITCTANGKIYVGQTVKDNLQSYFVHKLWTAEHAEGKTTPLYNAIKKYGRDAFSIKSLVETQKREHLNDLEKLFIRLYQSKKKSIGYNATDGGEGLQGYIVSEETKNKLSAIAKGKPKSEETKQRMRAASAARTPEYKSALSALANQKRQEKLSPEQRSALAKIGSDAALAKLGPYTPKPNPEVKTCRICSTPKPIDEFVKCWVRSKREPETGRWSYRTECKLCFQEYKRSRRVKVA